MGIITSLQIAELMKPGLAILSSSHTRIIHGVLLQAVEPCFAD
jgi:hypothetical protein